MGRRVEHPEITTAYLISLNQTMNTSAIPEYLKNNLGVTMSREAIYWRFRSADYEPIKHYKPPRVRTPAIKKRKELPPADELKKIYDILKSYEKVGRIFKVSAMTIRERIHEAKRES